MPDLFQSSYMVALFALAYPAWRAGHKRIVLVMLANMVAAFAIAGAWDLQLIGEDDRFAYYMVADMAAGAALVIRPGLSRVISIGYAATFPFYALRISDLFTGDGPPLTVICAQAALQIGALAIGTFGSSGGSGGGRRSRIRALPVAMGAPIRNRPVFGAEASLLLGKALCYDKARLKEAGDGS